MPLEAQAYSTLDCANPRKFFRAIYELSPKRGLFEPVLYQLAIQRGAADTQGFRGLALISLVPR